MPETMPEPEAERTSGRDRLVAALRRPASRSQLTAAVILAVLGFAAVVQLRANNQDDQFVGQSQQDLISLINTLSLATDRTSGEITDLQRTRESLQSDTRSSQAALDAARQEAQTLGILAGTLPATGPGVKVTVRFPEGGSIGTNLLLDGLEELRDAGAEAIELNDSVRVVAQTSISDGPGSTVLVDGNALPAPYTIEAIGSSSDLADALGFPGGFTSSVEQEEGTVDVTESSDIEIASTVGQSPTLSVSPSR